MPVRLGLEGSRCEHGTQADGLWAQRTFSPLSLIQRKGALLPLVQRSVTPLGRTDCKSVFQPLLGVTVLSFRIHREMLVLQMLRDALRLLGFNLLRGGA
jgi:hypothetical protein